MTIEKGREWGRPGIVPVDVVFAAEDSSVARFPTSHVLPTGGNLWRSLGSPVRKDAGDECTELTLDVLQCTVTGPSGIIEVMAVAQVVVGSWFAPGGMTVITNVGTLGELNIAPRAHPNDGEFDVFTLDRGTSMRQRLIARKRAVTGTHVPHPSMSVRRARNIDIDRRAREPLFIDGDEFGPWMRVTVGIRPDFMTVLV